jgi:hypothetical protein
MTRARSVGTGPISSPHPAPRVTPTGFTETGDDLVAVIDQRILDREGLPLVPPAVVFHRFTFAGDLISRMVVFSDLDSALAEY